MAPDVSHSTNELGYLDIGCAFNSHAVCLNQKKGEKLCSHEWTLRFEEFSISTWFSISTSRFEIWVEVEEKDFHMETPDGEWRSWAKSFILKIEQNHRETRSLTDKNRRKLIKNYSTEKIVSIFTRRRKKNLSNFPFFSFHISFADITSEHRRMQRIL